MAAPGSRADAIFVFAGSQERKEFGVQMWRRGDAPVLVVSVGRFDWRRYRLLGLPGDDALRLAVERVPPPERHFLVVAEGTDASVIEVPLHRFGTRNEARALAALVEGRGWKRVIVISSAFHLRRVALTVGRALRGSGVAAAYAALPAERDRYRAGLWWRSPRGIRFVLGEFLKLAIYRILLKP